MSAAHRHRGRDDHRVRRHHRPDGRAPQGVAMAGGLGLGRGGGDQEPTDQGEPDAVERLAEHQQGQPARHQGQPEAPSGSGRGRGGPVLVVPVRPEHGPQDAPTVEREGGDEVEHPEDHVDERQPPQRPRQQVEGGAETRDQRQPAGHDPQRQAGQRADRPRSAARHGRSGWSLRAGTPHPAARA